LATMEAVPRRPHVALMLRVPPELHARLAAVAEREHRSATAQVIHVLEQWLAQDEREQREKQEREGQPPPA
jgi:predicted HicB family RNase H-like nuclease